MVYCPRRQDAISLPFRRKMIEKDRKMYDRRKDEMREVMQKRRIIVGAVVVAVLAALVFAAFQLGIWIERRRPGTEVMSLEKYYEIEESEIVTVLARRTGDGSGGMVQEQIDKDMARMVDGQIYISLARAQELFLGRLYLDEYEEMVLFTTPTEVYCYPIGQTAYTVNGQPAEREQPMAVRLGEGVFVALVYLQEEVDFEAQYTEAPDRLVLFTEAGDYRFREVEKATQIRTSPNVKSEILKELAEGETLWLLTETEEELDSDGFCRVLSGDGVVGWVREKELAGEETAGKAFAEREEDYTSLSLDEPVTVVWHQVFNQTANSYLADKLDGTQGVNVVSPTWFSIEETSGKLTSLANQDYVDEVHSRGMMVWALVNDFNKDVDYNRLFGAETNRRNLINNLFYFINTFGLDGINIDFEGITAENSRAYIQFLRELSVACRNAGIYLSVDNYVPMEHTAFYDRAEQGVLVDYVMVMAYDEHYAGSESAGSVSSRSWVRTGITRTLEEVPAEKLVVGLPFYTRLWKEAVGEGGQRTLASEACSMNAARNLLLENEVEPSWDEETGQYYGEYTKDGTTYRIWMEEERSLAVKLSVLDEYSPAGVAFWKLGLERGEVWDVVEEWKAGAR